MSAILELKETPKLCGACDLSKKTKYETVYICNALKRRINCIWNKRHPDCPLKITEDNLRWTLYVKNFYGSNPNEKLYPCDLLECPKCHSKIIFAYAHCPYCGIKLLPPKETA